MPKWNERNITDYIRAANIDYELAQAHTLATEAMISGSSTMTEKGKSQLRRPFLQRPDGGSGSHQNDTSTDAIDSST